MFGLAAPLAERWQINADVTRTEIGDSVASAGVAAIPGTGAQTYYSASFVGSALFGASDGPLNGHCNSGVTIAWQPTSPRATGRQ